MGITKEQFIKEFKRRLTDEYALDVKDATPEELYQTLAAVVKSGYSDIWRKTWKNYIKEDQKQVYYFSIEFLPGRLLKSNLLNMGWYELVDSAFKEMGLSLDEIAEAERDMALGNGGLGRLASAFMDSSASDGLRSTATGFATSTACSSKSSLMAIRSSFRTNGSIKATSGKLRAKARPLTSNSAGRSIWKKLTAFFSRFTKILISSGLFLTTRESSATKTITSTR